MMLLTPAGVAAFRLKKSPSGPGLILALRTRAEQRNFAAAKEAAAQALFMLFMIRPTIAVTIAPDTPPPTSWPSQAPTSAPPAAP